MKLFTATNDDKEMNQVHLIINEGLVFQQLQGMVVTPSIIAQCIQQLNKRKGRRELWVHI